MDTLKLKKAWEIALAPVKGLPMTGIMMYMSGNSLQIFSIMMVFMAFKNPLMGLVNTNQAFEKFQTANNSGQMLQVKFVYVAMQIVALGVGIWKVNAMGLLPYVATWLASLVSFSLTLILQDDTVRLVDVGRSEGACGARCGSSMSRLQYLISLDNQTYSFRFHI